MDIVLDFSYFYDCSASILLFKIGKENDLAKFSINSIIILKFTVFMTTSIYTYNYIKKYIYIYIYNIMDNITC